MEYIDKLNVHTQQLNRDDIFEMDNLDDYHHILQKLTPNKENNEKLTLREQQLVCLDILDYFHALCETPNSLFSWWWNINRCYTPQRLYPLGRRY